jgi:snapalysin
MVIVPRQKKWFTSGLLAAAMSAAALVAGPSPASATPAAAAAVENAAVRILYYDASRAAEFVGAVNSGAAQWNARVTNMQLRPVPAGGRANITVYADNGWPRAITTSLGNGRFYMGRIAVQDGHDPTRIAAHEFGHLLGLPDRRTGRCTDLMSGSSAGTSCKIPYPNANEAREVNNLFAGSKVLATSTSATVIVD